MNEERSREGEGQEGVTKNTKMYLTCQPFSSHNMNGEALEDQSGTAEEDAHGAPRVVEKVPK